MAIARDQRSFQKLDWASTALKEAGFAFDGLTLGPDPPDCVAMFESGRAGIEVTELVDAEARKRTEAKNYTYREWDQPSFLSRIQENIDGKAAKPFQGGPYAHKVLAIWTDEPALVRATVERFLAGQRFQARAFDDVVLGLDYHPDHQYVAYRLTLSEPRG
jgi:hypothetical protein